MECDEVNKCTDDIKDMLTSIMNRQVGKTGQSLGLTVQVVWSGADVLPVARGFRWCCWCGRCWWWGCCDRWRWYCCCKW